MIHIQEARWLLRRAMQTQGEDFTYSPYSGASCVYRPIDPSETIMGKNDPRCKTGCLIGVALDLAGETRHWGASLTVWGLREKYPDMLSMHAMDYLNTAQTAQDMCHTWGASYARAEEWYYGMLMDGVVLL